MMAIINEACDSVRHSNTSMMASKWFKQQKCEGCILGCSGDFSGRVQGLEIKNNWKRRENKTLLAQEKDTATPSKELVQIVFPF